MQQPDYRDQSDAEVNGQTQEHSQSDVSSQTQKQEHSRQGEAEKEADDALVSGTAAQRSQTRRRHKQFILLAGNHRAHLLLPC